MYNKIAGIINEIVVLIDELATTTNRSWMFSAFKDQKYNQT